jgi:hypothetical protein
MSAGFKVLRDSIDVRAWHACGNLAAPFSAIVMGVTSCWLSQQRIMVKNKNLTHILAFSNRHELFITVMLWPL